MPSTELSRKIVPGKQQEHVRSKLVRSSEHYVLQANSLLVCLACHRGTVCSVTTDCSTGRMGVVKHERMVADCHFAFISPAT